MSPMARTAMLGTGGILGAGVFAFGNGFNSYLQYKVNSNNINNNSDNNNGLFSAKSIIEDNDNVDSIMNFLYFNLFISICILILLILLIYFYINKKDIYLYIT
jgi:hypothetical protein